MTGLLGRLLRLDIDEITFRKSLVLWNDDKMT
jgi:hypothetical protein